MLKISPCLWFNNNGKEAADFYVSIFKNYKITNISYYGEVGKEIHGQPVGSIMTVEFILDGNQFTALNGGSIFKFTEAISLQVFCATQEDIDYYWDKLSAGGDPEAQQCGWLKDKFGVSWQIVSSELAQMVCGDKDKSQNLMKALFPMKKLDIARLKQAYNEA